MLSGVNRGNNLGRNVMYSGHHRRRDGGGAAGLPAIALSQYMGQRTAALADPFEAAPVHGPRLIRQLLDTATGNADEDFRCSQYQLSALRCRGGVRIRVGRQGRRRASGSGSASSRPERAALPVGWRIANRAGDAGSDVDANMQATISR